MLKKSYFTPKRILFANFSVKPKSYFNLARALTNLIWEKGFSFGLQQMRMNMLILVTVKKKYQPHSAGG